MSRVKHSDGKEIIPKPAQVWMITFPDKSEQRLVVVDVSFNTDQVIRMISNHNPNREFTVQNISVGIFVLDKVINSYCDDARKVDHNGYFV